MIILVTMRVTVAGEDVIDAMDLRAFGVGSRTWLDVLDRDFKDHVLIWFGVAILVASISLGLFGYSQFWVSEILLRLFG